MGCTPGLLFFFIHMDDVSAVGNSGQAEVDSNLMFV